MRALGLAMFPVAMAGIALTGLPAWVVLIGTGLLFALVGAALGQFDLFLLQALPQRMLGLLEHDLLQALVLYAWIGALLNHLHVAPAWLRAARGALSRSGASTELGVLGLGFLTAPMNGSVGASLRMLARSAQQPLHDAAVDPARATALVCVASTLGVVVPPSLVMLLLGDAMMRAHSEALNLMQRHDRVLNNQDVIVAAWPAGLLVLLATAAVAWRAARAATGPAPGGGDASDIPATSHDRWLAVAATLVIGLLLGCVAFGLVYAVEGAATGGLLLAAYGVASGQMKGRWSKALGDAMTLTGMVFALLIGATTFTLVLRGLGTDRWLTSWLIEHQGGPGQALATVMALLLACACVLDAFEVIFLVVPVVMPALLSVVPDAAWVSVLTLVVLQIGFVLPPLGYAVLMSRDAMRPAPSPAALTRALLPYLGVLLLVFALFAALPRLAHLGG